MMHYPLRLDFLKALTDDTGLLQHAKYTVPVRKEGYCTDDNARAVIVCTRYLTQHHSSIVNKLLRTYLSFLLYMQREDGQLHNFLSYDRQYLDEVGSEDSMGHTVWACGTCLNSSLPADLKLAAKEIFDKVLPWALTFRSPRAKALSIMGLANYQTKFPTDKNAALNLEGLANQLVADYHAEADTDWKWFEPQLTYANARLPHALLLAHQATGKESYKTVALEALDFLINVQMNGNLFIPVGNHGWYQKKSDRAIYDQQAIEASCMVEAIATAYEATNNKPYLSFARDIFGWFLGKNLKNVSVYDQETGSCYDGITLHGVNLNRGAESMLAYLQACLVMRSTEKPPKVVLFGG
jgi:hypothetical protein